MPAARKPTRRKLGPEDYNYKTDWIIVADGQEIFPLYAEGMTIEEAVEYCLSEWNKPDGDDIIFFDVSLGRKYRTRRVIETRLEVQP